ncbi:phosphoglycerate dehydrogenase-related dehydrogenase [Corynebacterium humireducens NBRC 106098 = DSM 45392]|uniref:Phosphoglycerate dehydrogenase-related dehydrogenase n=1 Tax=Corynebacterium humireducens NBRC 106098 = DSM 45392 TaxID=1223515 RepID=A0A0B5D4U1_9CORY|nr:D-isomer specific 2-hydroxyacid dehydrogenase family protein [Corynebacterium humireducens]AJE33841.1 phosphoglycerate dehydrogenase-related dehydrogenase [Corynebacterium humireducens NBRC 106098 = DSM 45392]
MRFAFQPQQWPDAIAEIEAAGHTYVEDVHDADFLVFNGGPGKFPDPLPENIRYVQATFAGIDALVDAGLIRPGGVRWACASGLYDDTVAESTIAILLAQMHQHKMITLAGSWSVRREVDRRKQWLFDGKTVAIIGAGRIAVKLIEMLRVFGVRIIAVTRSGREVAGADESRAIAEVDEVWPVADVVVVLAPLTPETRHMINGDVFAQMKSTAVLVNVARGPLVHTEDLVEALRDGVIGGAALDVTDPEPLPDDHPLWDIDTCMITPHTANTYTVIQQRTGRLVVDNAAAFEAGERMPNEVDLEAGY